MVNRFHFNELGSMECVNDLKTNVYIGFSVGPYQIGADNLISRQAIYPFPIA